MTDFILAALIIHFFCCLLIFILIKSDLLIVSAQLFSLALFVPVCGMVMLMTAEYMSRRATNGTKNIQFDNLKLSEQDFRGTNLSQEDRLPSIVPFEEAIFVNDAKKRREFMMNIIGQDADQYIQLLQKAKFNDDIEVIHYASTAIMEIQREHEIALRRIEAAVQSDPGDTDALDAYLLNLKKYIFSGLIEENFLAIQRNRYHQAFLKRIRMQNVESTSYFDAADNLIEMNRFSDAEEVLQKAEEIWHEDERAYMLKLKICHLSKDREKKVQLIDVIKQKKVQMSAEAREMVDYWSK